MGSCFVIFTATVLSLLALHRICVGASVKMAVTPHFHDDVIPNSFNMRCSLPRRGNCAVTIVSMHLSKDGDKVIAGILRDDTIIYGRLLRPSVAAEGHIDERDGDSFLSVTVNDAVVEDSGRYTCTISYLDDSLHARKEFTSQNVTINGQDTRDLVRHLLSKLSFLENLLNFQQEQHQRNYTLLKSQLAMQDLKDQEHAIKMQALQDMVNKLVQVTQCPDKWQYYQGSESCLRSFFEEKPFGEARRTCHAEGGDLVKIDSQTKTDFVRTLCNPNTNYWIGVWDQHHNQQWTYVDGSSLTYSSWLQGQPDNAGNDEACAHIWSKNSGEHWNDNRCVHPFRFVCEIPVSIK